LNLMGRKATLFIHAHDELMPILKTVLKIDQEIWGYEVVVLPLNFEAPEIIFEDTKVKVTSFPLRHSIPVCGFLFEEKPRPRKIKKDVVQEMQLTIKEINELKNGFDLVREDVIYKNTELTVEPLPVRKYAYATDTLKCSQISEIVREVNLFYHEATFLHQDLSLARATCHTTAIQAAQIAKEAQVKKLLLGHFSSRYTNPMVIENEAKTIFPNSIAVSDGDSFSIGFSGEDQ
jgi:ribonuclease Z